MTTTSYEPALEAVDVRHLQYFAMVAQERNLRRAAERLYMAQPPLSRQIKQLEERLGVALFTRHSKGLSLTAEGERVLEIIRPLLRQREETYERLRKEIRPQGGVLRLGLSTAFEQGVFSKLETVLRERYGGRLRIRRASSPKIAADVRKGRLDAAFVALPLEAPGLEVLETAYAEPLVAAVPASWLQEPQETHVNEGMIRLPLERFNGKPLFWFRREANPAFFDFTRSRFALAGFAPRYLEEPVEHDVLLARIAAGEGMSLFAASFAAIRRDGVRFAALSEGLELRLRLGLVSLSGKAALARQLTEALPVL